MKNTVQYWYYKGVWGGEKFSSVLYVIIPQHGRRPPPTSSRLFLSLVPRPPSTYIRSLK